MNENFSQTDAVPFSTEFLDTRQCLLLHQEFNDFENRVFGPDFACDDAWLKPWLDSGCLFYSAVCGEVVAGRRNLLSVASVFVTTNFSRNRMISGAIADYEMVPWTCAPDRAQPSLYLSSVVSCAPHHLTAMYASLFRDIENFRNIHGISFHTGFGIAAGAAGFRHMERSGFWLLSGHKYRGKYDLMGITAHTANSEFWRGLLQDETTFLRRQELDRVIRVMVAETPFTPSQANPLAVGS